MSELKGDLARKLNSANTSLTEKPTELGIGSQLVQRDGGIVFTIEQINKTKHHPDGMAILKGPNGQTVTRGVSDLNKILESEDGPWKR